MADSWDCDKELLKKSEGGIADVARRTKTPVALSLVGRSSKSSRRRRVCSGREMELSREACVQLRRRRRVVVTPERSVVPYASGQCNVNHEDPPSSCPSLDHVAHSWCSNNFSNEQVKEIIALVDVEDLNGEGEGEASRCNGDRERSSETKPSNDFHSESKNLESMEGTTNGSSCCRFPAEKAPTDAELEEFFSVAEKDNQKRFEQKYNYDFAKDEPLEGRYEWVRLKP